MVQQARLFKEDNTVACGVTKNVLCVCAEFEGVCVSVTKSNG